MWLQNPLKTALKVAPGGTVSLSTALFGVDNWHNAKEKHGIKDAIRSLAKYENGDLLQLT